jgi:hypothetical protein
MGKTGSVKRAAERIVELEAELESAGNAVTGKNELARMRSALHGWVETVVGVVNSPGSGRVALIHTNGSQSSIASPDLPYLLAKPVIFEGV